MSFKAYSLHVYLKFFKFHLPYTFANCPGGNLKNDLSNLAFGGSKLWKDKSMEFHFKIPILYIQIKPRDCKLFIFRRINRIYTKINESNLRERVWVVSNPPSWYTSSSFWAGFSKGAAVTRGWTLKKFSVKKSQSIENNWHITRLSELGPFVESII